MISTSLRYYPESQGHADQDRDGQVHPDVQEQGWSPGGVEDGLLQVGRCHGKQINFNQIVTVMSLLTLKIGSLDSTGCASENGKNGRQSLNSHKIYNSWNFLLKI